MTAMNLFSRRTTSAHKGLWARLNELFLEERRKGCARRIANSQLNTSHDPGYIDRANEVIVGLQTEAPLKRSIMPNGRFPNGPECSSDLRV
jgi:formate C-acetyltransferase